MRSVYAGILRLCFLPDDSGMIPGVGFGQAEGCPEAA